MDVRKEGETEVYRIRGVVNLVGRLEIGELRLGILNGIANFMKNPISRNSGTFPGHKSWTCHSQFPRQFNLSL